MSFLKNFRMTQMTHVTNNLTPIKLASSASLASFLQQLTLFPLFFDLCSKNFYMFAFVLLRILRIEFWHMGKKTHPLECTQATVAVSIKWMCKIAAHWWFLPSATSEIGSAPFIILFNVDVLLRRFEVVYGLDNFNHSCGGFYVS